MRQISRFVFAAALAVVVFGTSTVPNAIAVQTNPVNLKQYDMLTASSGWVLMDQHLFWSSDAGQSWEEIGPSIPDGGSIEDVYFLDENTGWILWDRVDDDGSSAFHLDHTMDHGKTWTTRPLSLFAPEDVASHAEKADMGWLGSQAGWISVKQQSGSNFSIGTLFTTSDGGNTWSRSPLPVADQVHFVDPQNGWAVGGPPGDQVFQTWDAGLTWEDGRPVDLPEGVQSTMYAPFVSGAEGLLVMTTTGTENKLKAYALDRFSAQWTPIGEEEMDIQPGRIGLSILDAQNFVAAIPGTNSIVRMVNGRLGTLKNQDGLSASITELDMVSLEVGWAKWVESTCPSDAFCTTTVRLLKTINGGITWTPLKLPLIQTNKITLNFPSVNDGTPQASDLTNLENTETYIGQGFDRCEIPTVSQMQTWSTSSPYEVVNLYIGGSSRGCSNNALISSYLFQLSQQGWKFIPTWVGPQAPCTGFSSRMSSDPATAYDQGVAEANLAVERLAALGLTGPNKTGSVAYYDIEAYGTNQACRNAVNSFMSGWVTQLHTRGSMAGVYGSTLCNTGLSDFLNLDYAPDVIWAARWYHNLGYGFYDPSASVWNLGSCIPDTVWQDHQRIRQYEGDHDETWGNLTMNIDSNVLDGVVAVPYDYPYVSSIVTANANPTNADTVDFTVNFSKPVTGVNQADFKLATTGVTGASITNASGSGGTYTVTVDTGSGNGAIRLDLLDDDSILDANNNPLGGAGKGNGNYSSGERYNIVTGADTVGVFRPSNGLLYLKNKNASGFADIAINYGLGGDYPVVGDWDGDGTDTIGVYRGNTFLLRNSNTVGVADLSFIFGQAGDQPIAGDWNGDGEDTIGVYRPSTGQFLLRNANSAGTPSVTFYLGNVGDVGIAGDWDGDGIDTTGVFRPSNGIIFLKNTNATGYADVALNYGLAGDKPVVGDWDNDGDTTIGIYRGARFYLRNSNTNGFADIILDLGNWGDMPIAGNWDGVP